MTLTSRLALLAARGVYVEQGTVSRRWGQLLRESSEAAAFLEQGRASGRLVPLRDIASIQGGVVTRANGYFIVRELPYASIPRRFGITRRDFRTVAVVLDGKDAPFRIEREFLLPVLKGPESLLTSLSHEESDERLFVVGYSKEELRRRGNTGALTYLKRGETVPYSLSEDSLKGGIPAQRSNIRNRRPFWYCLAIPTRVGPRIIVPEHIDHRYIATLLSADDDTVVIDKLYLVEPQTQEAAGVIHMGLNSLLAWYQMELRGRTQLGEGVLELKVPDWGGILVVNPASLRPRDAAALRSAFAALSDIPVNDSAATIGDQERMGFDELYFKIAGARDPRAERLFFERELRAAVAERHDRRASVVEAKTERRRSTRVPASIDAHAARIAANLEPFPDPREHVPPDMSTWTIPITGHVGGPFRIGTELFDQGDVYSGDECIAHAGDMLGAQFVVGVLLRDPEVSSVDVPTEPGLTSVMTTWRVETHSWRQRFDSIASDVTRLLADDRLTNAIVQRALSLLHAQ